MNKDGHPAWRFISVKHWDEYPRGTWTIRISNTNAEDRTGRSSVRRLTRPSHAMGDHPSTTTKVYPKHTEHLLGNHGPSSSSSTAPSGTMAGLAAGVFLCSRAVRRHCAEGHSAFPGNDLMLSALTRGGRGLRRKELHDVFCEQGYDEDEDQWDEHTSLRTGSRRDRVQDGFQEGFLG
ncbi:hypothetical protein EDB85DRAFT_2004589, partial [Lactarius pseudohatsudake]